MVAAPRRRGDTHVEATLETEDRRHMIPFGTRMLRALTASTCAVAVLLLVALSGSASAAEVTGYGELTRFGTPPKGGRLAEAGPNELSEARTLSIGVDPRKKTASSCSKNARNRNSRKKKSRAPASSA